jgi:hypothetical protein
MTLLWRVTAGLILLCACCVWAQQATPVSRTPSQGNAAPTVPLLHASGKLSVNGAKVPMTTSIFDQDVVDMDTQSAGRFSSAGNTLMFTPGSNFTAKKNAYRLEKGGSRVATYTGMTAEVNCFSVTPVNPVYTTLYEVNWVDSAVWVYARSEDVYIYQHGAGSTIDRKWLLQQGKIARIREARLCKPLLDIYPQPELPYAVGFGAWSAAIVLAETYPWHKQDMSQPALNGIH